MGSRKGEGKMGNLNPVSLTGKVINKQVYVPVRCGTSIVLETSVLHGEESVEEIFVLHVLCMDKQLRRLSGKVSAASIHRQ